VVDDPAADDHTIWSTGLLTKKGGVVLEKYPQFLKRMSEHATGVTLMDSSSTLYDILKEDLTNPSFMNDIMDFYKIEMIQG